MSASFPPMDPVEERVWRARVEAELKGASFEETLCTTLPSGLTVQPLYAASTSSQKRPVGLACDQRHRSPESGTFSHWLKCRRYLLDSSKTVDTQNAIQVDLQGGHNAVWFGLGSGQLTGKDIKSTFTGMISLGLPIIFEPSAHILAGAALAYSSLPESKDKKKGSHLLLSADPLGLLAANGTLPCTLAEAETQLGVLARYGHERSDGTRSVGVSTLVYQEAGAHAAQELGVALATAVHYLRIMEAHGLSLEDAFAQTWFRFSLGGDFFVEVSKLRAARHLWAQLQTVCKIKSAHPMWIHAVTSRRLLAQQAPWVNLLRHTQAVFSGAVGNADCITCHAHNEASPLGTRLARNVQNVLDEECGVGDIWDPAGGSYYVETLTQQLAAQAWKIFQEIEGAGGMAQVLLKGTIQCQVQQSWETRRDRVLDESDILVGVNRFNNAANSMDGAGDTEAFSRPDLGDPVSRLRFEAPSGSNGSLDAKGFELALAGARSGQSLGELAKGFAVNGETRITELRLRAESDAIGEGA